MVQYLTIPCIIKMTVIPISDDYQHYAYTTTRMLIYIYMLRG